MDNFNYNDEEFEGEDYEGLEDYTVADAVAALPLDPNAVIPAEVVFGFSDLLVEEREEIRPFWKKLPQDQRLLIMERLGEVSEVDYELDYSIFAQLGYDDPDAAVRIAAIKAGWTDETPETLHTLMEIARRDPVTDVRSAALVQIGMYIQLGEVDDQFKPQSQPAEEFALSLLNNPNEPLDIHRRALEAVAHCTRPEVPPLIENAYNHDDLRMRISAVNAMANSCDEQWSSYVMEELQGDNPEMVFEAVRAAGTIGIEESVELLGELGYSTDSQIQEGAIWSLGEIGGDKAVEILYELADHAEEEDNEILAEAIEDALGMAEVLGSFADGLGMLDFDFLDGEEDFDDEE